MRIHRGSLLASVACIAIGMSFVWWFDVSESRPDESRVSAAQDGVYEAVVRDMTTPTHEPPRVRQLVFGDMALSDLAPGANIQSCEEGVRKGYRLQGNEPPPFNSFTDKVYRAVTRRRIDGTLPEDTIQDFLEKSCSIARLSHAFHTDVPRTFVQPASVRFADWVDEKDSSPSLKQQFPGAPGIISFSRVGFDPTLHEAIVSTAFVCGMLCGTGQRYILRRTFGAWEIVDKCIIWLS